MLAREGDGPLCRSLFFWRLGSPWAPGIKKKKKKKTSRDIFHRRWSSGQQARQSASCHNTQANPEDDGDQPGRRSDLAGAEVVLKVVVTDVSIRKEMRAVNQYCWWASRGGSGVAAIRAVVLPREMDDVRRFQPRPQAQGCKLEPWDIPKNPPGEQWSRRATDR